MSTLIQGFYVSSKSTNTVELSPLPATKGGEARPAQLAATHMTVTTSASTAPTEFWPSAASCGIYEVHFLRRG